LFIVEGDSALGTAKLARNSDHQALLPIRGKILNVQKASVADMLGTPSARRSSRSSAPGRGAPSISSRPATARSSS
jgi:DNA gyrase subunit B